MPYSVSLDLLPKQKQTLKQIQRLMMSPQMQQALRFLQMPILELAAKLESEVEQNPLLEIEETEESFELEILEEETTEMDQDTDTPVEKELSFEENSFEILRQLDEEFRDYFTDSESHFFKRNIEEDKIKTFQENSVCAHPTLHESLMRQAKEILDISEEIEMAEAIIGNFDSAGFLSTSLEEIAYSNNWEIEKLKKLLHQIQNFEPSGIGARDLRESLLIQLRHQNKMKHLSFKMIEKCYDDLLHNRIPHICKIFHCSAEDILKAIRDDICKLDFHPGNFYQQQPSQQYITPDVSIRLENQQLIVSTNDAILPTLRLNSRYLRMLENESLSDEVKEFIRHRLLSAKWLIRSIDQRNETIEKIARAICEKQRDYILNPHGKLTPMAMKDLAEELNLHESTVARAIANKYIDCPRGLLSLRSFFSHAYIDREGKGISSKTVQDVLIEIIKNENKNKPLSDEEISKEMKMQGITCARRTIAKYRSLLHLGTAQQRKKFNKSIQTQLAP